MRDGQTLRRVGHPHVGGLRSGDPRILVALLGGLEALWVLWYPPSPDLADAVYRTLLFSKEGYALWDNNWYSGHYVPGYSLVFGPLAGLLGLRVLGVTAVACSTLIFSRLARAAFSHRWVVATAMFAISAAGDLFIGRIAFAVGVTFGLAAILAAARGRLGLASVASLACASASPVAALFLALAGVVDLIVHRRLRRALALIAPSCVLTVAIAVVFPEGGIETFGPLSMLAAFGYSFALAIVLAPRERLLRTGLAVYLLALIASYAIPAPMGSNAVRLGILFCPAILVGAVDARDVQRTLTRAARAWGRVVSVSPFISAVHPRTRPTRAHGGEIGPTRTNIGQGLSRAVLVALTAGIVAWQVDGPITQSVRAAADPSTSYSYYVPVIRYLDAHRGAEPMRIEAVFSRDHWESVFLGRRFDLARGWERQLDIHYDSLFYDGHLNAATYHTWLTDNGVRYVVLSDAPLDFSSVAEAALIRGGLPYLRAVFTSADWHIYAVLRPTPLARGPGRMTAIDGDSFTLKVARPGSFLVRIHYTPYWSVSAGTGSVTQAAGDWTRVTARHRGKITIDAKFPIL